MTSLPLSPRTLIAASAFAALTALAAQAAAQDPAPPERPPLPPPERLVAATDNRGLTREEAPYFPVSLALLHPLSSNIGAPELRTNLALSVLFGRVGYLEGLQLGLINSTLHAVRGAQIGGASVSEGSIEGLQLGAVVAYATGPVGGAQVGIASIDWGPVAGLQVGALLAGSGGPVRGAQIGAFSLAGGQTDGVQLGGALAYTGGRVRGLQLAGVMSSATGPVIGVQAAGLTSQTSGRVEGLQISGLFNLARGEEGVMGAQIGVANVGRVGGLQLGAVNVSEEVRGLQIGLVNIAQKIDGMQIGLINITDTLEGESFGLISIPRRGGVHLMAWGSNSLSGNLGFKFASRYTYSILSTAAHRDGKDTVIAAGLTFGLRFPFLIKPLSWSADLGGYRLFRIDVPRTAHDEMVKTRLLISYEIARHFSVFAGGGAYVSVRGDSSPTSKFGPELCAGLDL